MKPVQCRMARAALEWTTVELGLRAQVGANTVNRFEGGHDARLSSIEKMRAVFEAAGAIFVDDDEGIGVRLGRRNSKERLKRLELVSSSPLAVTLKTADSAGSIVVSAQRVAIDVRFKLTASTDPQRLLIVEENLDAILEHVQARIESNTRIQGLYGGPRQVVISLDDFNHLQLREPR